jgi:hypothetical protein
MSDRVVIPRPYRVKPPLKDRIDELVSIIPITGCWMWMGSLLRNGYARFTINHRSVLAHRTLFIALRGDIGDAMLDHRCRHRWCVNPDHLEPVTAFENWRRGFSPSAIASRKTHCRRGHEWTEANTRPVKGRIRARVCRECDRIRNLERRNKCSTN